MEVAVGGAARNLLLQPVYQPVDFDYFNLAQQLPAWNQSQSDRGHNAKQSVTAHDVPEELGTLIAAALNQSGISRNDFE